MKQHHTLGACILDMPERDPQRTAIQFKSGREWTKKTWPEYYRDIENAGAGLLFLGVQPGDRVAIMSNTRYEWCVTDFASIGIKAVIIPVYQNNTAEDVEYILNNSDAKFFIVNFSFELKSGHDALNFNQILWRGAISSDDGRK